MNDAQLLQAFAGENSEAAFRTLVERHLPLVFGTARRMTDDSALAEDIAQTVFILLARKASRLGGDTILAGWLYRTTRFVASRALTGEWRRRRREQEAVTMQTSAPTDNAWLRLGPQLDEALARLGDTDRNAILLRYFEQQSLRDVGLALGLSEEAAKKRVARAQEKLRRMLSRRGAEITAAVLAAGLAREAAEGASALPLAGKISGMVIAHGAAGASAAAGSALLTEVLAAMRWAKIQFAAVAVVAVVATALVVPSAGRYWQSRANAPRVDANPSGLAQGAGLQRVASRSAVSPANSAGALRTLLVTVLDAKTGKPIKGATLTPYVNGVFVPEYQNPFKTSSDGMVKLPIPENVPGGERGDYCEIPVNAPGYATRVMRWSSATGMVLNVVASQHTVLLSRGVTLSGVVLDDSGNPLAGLRIGAIGFGLIGETTRMESDGQGHLIRTPAVHQEDYSSYYLTMEKNPTVTDAEGRFKLKDYPGEVRPFEIDLQGPDGGMHKFQTPEGFAIHAETLPKVSLSELKNGTARIVIPQGVNVQGIVVNNAGVPLAGAQVLEATEWGNLRVLSTNQTDASGRFCLSNRPPHEVILGVSAAGYASVSSIVSIQPGLEPVRLQLAPELPLWGRVVGAAGLPVEGAEVSTPDILNPGQGVLWSGKTDAIGEFSWRGAPTNEVSVMIAASGHAPCAVRLRASTNEAFITLRTGDNDIVHVTGRVTDADSGTPLDQFQMKISNGMTGNAPMGPTQDFEGSNGEINLKLSLKDFPVSMMEAWVMSVEAEGYDAALSRIYYLQEGDQELDVKLKRGGTMEGVVRTPAGEAAAGAQLAFTTEGDRSVSSFGGGQLPAQLIAGKSDANGQFKVKKPLLPRNLVVFHDAGWAVVPITAGAQKADVNLAPWARLEGTLATGTAPVSGQEIKLEDLAWDYSDALSSFYSATSDDEGHFVFDKVPAGSFRLSCHVVESGKWEVSTWQTSVTVAAGETKSVEMASKGLTVSAQLLAPPGSGTINWSNVLATLSTDVQLPTAPGRADFISEAAHEAAHLRYTRDPAVLAALGRQKTFAGAVGPDGVVVFQQVPADNYVLEVKLFNTSKTPSAPNINIEPGVVIASLRAAVTVPQATDASENPAPVTLGDFTLDPL